MPMCGSSASPGTELPRNVAARGMVGSMGGSMTGTHGLCAGWVMKSRVVPRKPPYMKSDKPSETASPSPPEARTNWPGACVPGETEPRNAAPRSPCPSVPRSIGTQAESVLMP